MDQISAVSLGMKREEETVVHEYELFDVQGLPAGVSARIIKQRNNDFRVYRLDVPMEATARIHDSMEAALQELAASVKN